MTKTFRSSILFAVAALICSGVVPLRAADPLPSWTDSPLKASITDFVARVTTPDGPDFVPEAERIAVFDNDGTLCAEQPMYFQFAFAQQRVKAEAAHHPEWKDRQPFKAALEDDLAALGQTEIKGLTEIIAGACAGQSTDEFRQGVKQWMTTARHPTLGRPYAELVYQPMLELLAYLRANGFKTYIVTGSDAEFLRGWAAVYGVPPEQIIGSSAETTVRVRDGRVDIAFAEGAALIINRAGKATAIERIIGRRPVFAIGNSDGDLDMLRLAAGGGRPAWTGLVHHTDDVREFAYDRNTYFGRLDAGLRDAEANHWWIVDMKVDWKQVFP